MLGLGRVSARQRRLRCEQARATTFVSEVKANPEVWRLCCERFPVTQYPEVKFWCLQTLHEVSAGRWQRPACMHTCMRGAGLRLWCTHVPHPAHAHVGRQGFLQQLSGACED